MRILTAAAFILALTGCATSRGPERAAAAADWRSVATEDDRKRLRDWRGDFARAGAGGIYS